MALGFKRGRDAIKTALDRRYLTRSEMASVGDALGDVAAGVESLEYEVIALRTSLGELTETVHRVGARVQDVERLANECALAIERLLQEEVLLRRDFDANAS